MPIKGLSDITRWPRLGKIHTGKKVPTASGGLRPAATEYFVLPDELKGLLGEEPTELDIMFPAEDPEMFASQYYKSYTFDGLLCKGDGERCTRKIDPTTKDYFTSTSKGFEMVDLPCPGRSCPRYTEKKCKEIMCLQFLMPSIPGLGIWQLDTGSYHGMVAINSSIAMIKAICGRISMIPLKLVLEPKDVSPDGKKKTVRVLAVRINATLDKMKQLASEPLSNMLPPPPDESLPELLVVDPATGEILEEPNLDSDAEFDAIPSAGDEYRATKATEAVTPPAKPATPPNPYGFIPVELLKRIKDAGAWSSMEKDLVEKYGATTGTPKAKLASLSLEKAIAFTKEAEERIEAAGG